MRCTVHVRAPKLIHQRKGGLDLKKIISLCLVLALSLPLLFSCFGGAEYKTKINVTDKTKISYTLKQKNEAAEYVFNKVSLLSDANFIKDNQGNITSAAKNLISAAEAREIRYDDILFVFEIIFGDEQRLRAFISAVREDKPFPIEDSADVFSLIASRLGSEKTALLSYDLFICLCDFMNVYYLGIYNKNTAYSHILRDALLWQEYKRSAESIGEESFSSVTRLFAATLGLRRVREEGASSFVGSLSAGEVRMLLSLEGGLISQLSLSKDDCLFIIKFMYNEVGSLGLSAVFSAGEEGELASLLSCLLPEIGLSLSRVSVNGAESLLQAKPSPFVKELVLGLPEDKTDAVLSPAFGLDDAKYSSFLVRKKLSGKYAQYKADMEIVNKSELFAASDEEFCKKLLGCINESNPVLGFLITEELGY